MSNNIDFNIDGRKIPSNYENPIDCILINICDKLIGTCQKNNISPNVITSFRILIGIFVIKSLMTTKNITFPIIGTILFYFLDNLDGHLARKTKQVTIIGDYLDHIADVSFGLSLLYYFVRNRYENKMLMIFILLVFLYLSFVHLGLQQLNYDKLFNDFKDKNNINEERQPETLDMLNKLHFFEDHNINWSKYFGTGTLYFIFLIFIYYIQNNKL